MDAETRNQVFQKVAWQATVLGSSRQFVLLKLSRLLQVHLKLRGSKRLSLRKGLVCHLLFHRIPYYFPNAELTGRGTQDLGNE